MRRPLAAELSAEDQSLARRWAIAIPSFYSTIVAIVVVVAVLTSSTAKKLTVVASSEQKNLLQDRSGVRPYGSLPNIVVTCTASQPCIDQGRSRP